MITAHVKLFANFRKRCPEVAIGEAMPIQLPVGATVGELTEQLELPGIKLIFVNGVAQKEEFVLQDQDEVAIIPPVGGG